MDRFRDETRDEDVEAFLRRRRRLPDAGWVERTEQRLLPAREQWWSQWRAVPVLRMPVLRLSAGLAIVGAALLLALSLAGAGPLAGSDQSVEAKRTCEPVTVTRTVRVPRLVERADGQVTVEYVRRPVQRVEQRCR